MRLQRWGSKWSRNEVVTFIGFTSADKTLPSVICPSVFLYLLFFFFFINFSRESVSRYWIEPKLFLNFYTTRTRLVKVNKCGSIKKWCVCFPHAARRARPVWRNYFAGSLHHPLCYRTALHTADLRLWPTKCRNQIFSCGRYLKGESSLCLTWQNYRISCTSDTGLQFSEMTDRRGCDGKRALRSHCTPLGITATFMTFVCADVSSAWASQKKQHQQLKKPTTTKFHGAAAKFGTTLQWTDTLSRGKIYSPTKLMEEHFILWREHSQSLWGEKCFLWM